MGCSVRSFALARLASSVIAASVSSCSPFTSEPTSAEVPDAQAPAADAGASPPGVSVDAGPSPCPGVFCDDFERKAVGGPWDVSTPSGGNAIALDDRRSRSGSKSLRGIASGTAGSAYLRRSLPPGSTLDVELWLWIERLPDAHVYVAQFAFDQSLVVGAALTNGGIKIAEQRADQSGSYSETETVSLKTGSWISLRLRVANAIATLQIDGDPPALVKPLTNALTEIDSVRIGVVYAKDLSSGPHDAWIDDVIVR